MEEMNQNEENQAIDNTEAVSAGQEEEILQIKKETLDAILKKEYKRGSRKGTILTSLLFVLVIVIFLAVKFVVALLDGSIYASVVSIGTDSLLDSKSVNKINQIYRIINSEFIDETDKEVLREGLYRGLMDSLDDVYSIYYTKDEYKEMIESAEGTFEGIGAYLSQDPDTMLIKVVKPIKGSPAEEVGIIADDILVYVDGEDISGQDLNVVVSKVRGEEGTSVNIGIAREGEDDIIYFDITRRKIDSISCDYEMLDNQIGYIAISEFADATDEQFMEAYDSLTADGMTSLIIDLRSNGGGFVDTSVNIADRLVKEGMIVSIKSRTGTEYAYEDAGDEKYMDLPCVVLVDGNTASASEILTGALKDYGLVTVIGTNTFGKGIVQDVLPLDDGSGIKITSSKYYTPNGNNIHGVGIAPDIEVKWDGEKYVNEKIDNQLEAAKNYLLYGNVEGNE